MQTRKLSPFTSQISMLTRWNGHSLCVAGSSGSLFCVDCFWRRFLQFAILSLMSLLIFAYHTDLMARSRHLTMPVSIMDPLQNVTPKRLRNDYSVSSHRDVMPYTYISSHNVQISCFYPEFLLVGGELYSRVPSFWVSSLILSSSRLGTGHDNVTLFT